MFSDTIRLWLSGLRSIAGGRFQTVVLNIMTLLRYLIFVSTSDIFG